MLSQVRNATTTSLVYYTLNEQDGSGATRRETLGNGVVERYTYEPTTGRLASIKTGPTGATLQDLEFEWDLAGNLEQREIRNSSGTLIDTDVFNYDALDRLTSVVRDSVTTFSVGYTTDKLGNIASKTGITGTYTYGGSRPHAVTAVGSTTFAYDANGNMTDRGTDIDIDWTSFNLPSRIERTSGEYSEFVYGADRSRYVQVEGSGSLTSTRHYASPGLFEVLTWASGASRVDYHYIHANGRAVAQFTTSNVEADELQYLHRDHQGSVVATSSTSGTVLDRFEYDAFGKRTVTAGDDDRSHRGYTGHEHLAALDLIHMNGRVQDPVLGRFLSPDPLVQAPHSSQSLNRYSYVWNNPLSLVDPSGFETKGDEGNSDECRLGALEKCTDAQRRAMECMQIYCTTVYGDESGNTSSLPTPGVHSYAYDRGYGFLGGEGVGSRQDFGGSWVEEVVVTIVEPWQQPVALPVSPLVTVTPQEAARLYQQSPFEEGRLSRQQRREIRDILRNRTFRTEAGKILTASKNQTPVRELGALRVHERGGVYSVYSVGRPSAEQANRLNIDAVDNSLGRHVFDMHPHPSGNSRPSPADLQTSYRQGAPGVVNYDPGSFTIYQGACKSGAQC